MSELAASQSTDLAARPLPMSGKAGGIVQQIKNFIAQPAVAKSLPLVGFISMIALAALMWMAFSAAPGRTLFSGLEDADKASVAEALESAGIRHAIDSSTGALSVSEDDYHQARMLLASQGLPRSAPDGTKVMEELPMGASRAVEGERIRSARQTDLARTIEAIDAVRTARVHIADHGQSVFVRDRAAPGASVMLTLEGGRTLSDGQVQAIIHLVASSVPGLSPDGVSVVDQNGRLLSGGGGGAAGASGEFERQIAVQQAVEDRYRQAIATLLTPIVGAGNFTAEVHADMDFSQVEASREAYPEASRTLRAEQGTVSSETGSGAGQAVGGIPGTLANEAPPPATVADPNVPAVPGAVPGTQETRRNEQYARNYAVGREVSVTRNQTGTVKRLSVAVALRNVEGGKTLTRDELQSMENLVRGAVGANQERGDVIAITARAFATEEPPVTSWWQEAWLSPLVRSAFGLIIALAVVFGLGRPMMKKMSAAAKLKAEARSSAVGQEIAAALADRGKGDKVTIDMIEAAPSYEARAALIRSFVRQDPARAALVVRDLIRADTKGAHHA
jgi:flagellar M-ring protein FliF